MIQIYKANNTNYGTNGDMVLLPTECTIEAELNGAWELTLEHPIDEEGRYKQIESGAVLSVPSFVSDKQLFRIYNTVKTDTGVTAYARPVFMDAAGEVWLMDTRPTLKSGQGALDEMLRGQSKYKGTSDITTISTAYYIRQNLIEALQSDHDESFLNRWGGEVWYDNYTVRILKRVGGNYGVRVELGRNCLGIEADVDMSEVVTRIVPVSYNGYILDGNTPWVDSPMIGNYPVIYTKEIKFDDVKLTEDAQEDEKSFATLELLKAELVRRCKEQFDNGIDKPVCNYKCDMVQLSNTEEYADVKILETVGLGDTVSCKNKVLDIETNGRVVKVTWDCIHNRNESVELGDFAYNYFGKITSTMNRVNDAIRSDGSVIAEQVVGIIDGIKSQMRAQNSIAKKSDVRAILFEDLDPNSKTFGAMCLGTMGFQIAGSRTADNRDWDWRTFGTGQGFFADLMVAGSLISRNWIKDLAGFRMNLDEGTINSKHLKLDADGLLTIYKALISGGEFTIGGADGNDGFLLIKDTAGNEIGRWSKTGIDVKSGSITGTSITLGGRNNTYGLLKLLAGNGVELIRLDADGVYAKGKYVCEGEKYGRNVEISEGAYKILNSSGGEVGKLIAISDKWMRLECGNVAIRFMENEIYIDAPKIGPDGYSGKTGRAVFSDGSYLDFRKGFLIGGQTADGGTI